MKKTGRGLEPGKEVFIGIDLHLRSWHVTVRTEEDELFSGSIPGKCDP